MKRFRFLLLLFSLISGLAAQAQWLLKGVVVDAEKGSPIPKASVFLNNTSVGTTANDQGRFELTVPAGRYELIVSSVGFATSNTIISSADAQASITIKLAPKVAELEAVVVEPYVKDGWQQWGNFFLENFIGTSAMAADCKILNQKAIRFRHSKKTNRLTAHAFEPLLIENKALGYRIRYQMELFQYDFETRYVVYVGYPFFEPMQGNQRRVKNWQQKRSEVYYGSLMHFMRSVYRNKIKEEGFETRRLQKISNTEKERIREVYRTRGVPKIKDTSDYYERILRQPDQKEIVGRDILIGDSIAYAIDSVTAGLHFPNYLYVHYIKGTAPAAFVKMYPKSSHAMLSHLLLLNGEAIAIQSNGIYYNPIELLASGYWSWSEKMATMLPYDYWPPK